MKIPRYTSNLGSAPIQSGRTLTTGTGSAQGMVNLGQTMLDSISSFAQAKQAVEMKLRDQEVLNLKTLSEGDSLMAANDFNFGLENRKDYKNFLPEYDKMWNLHTNKVKKERFTDKQGNFDEYAWKQYEPFHNKTYIEGRVGVQGNISKARNAQSVASYQTNYDATTTKFSTSTSTAQVVGNWQEWENGTFNKYKGLATFDQGALDTGYDKMLATANNQMMLLQSGDNGKMPIYQNPNGKTATDWSVVAEKAADPTVKMFDVQGNELTVDDPARKEFIKSARAQATEQESFDQNQITINARDDKNTFSDRIIAVRQGKADPTFLKDLESNTNLEGGDKTTLANAYSAAITSLKEGTKLWDTPQGRKTDALLTTMVMSGAIDTEQEKDVIYQAMMEGYLDPARGKTLLGEVEKLQKDRNSHKMLLYKRAVKTILKETGAPPSILESIDGLNAGSAADTYQQLSMILGDTNLSETSLIAVQNLDRILAEGERKNMSMYDMLGNANSPNYVVREITTVYKEQIKEDRIKDYTAKSNAYMKTDDETKAQGLYRIDPVGFVNYQGRGGTSAATPPLRNDNEPINTYILRLQKWNNEQAAITSGGPSFLRSDVVGGASTQGIAILPTGE